MPCFHMDNLDTHDTDYLNIAENPIPIHLTFSKLASIDIERKFAISVINGASYFLSKGLLNIKYPPES